MLLRRPYHIALLCLLIVSLLIGPAVTSGYVWCVTLDGHRGLEAVIAGDCAAGNPVEGAENLAGAALSFAPDDDCGPCLDISTAHHWGNARPRQDDLPVHLLPNLATPTAVAPVPLPERYLHTHRVVAAPRTPDPILHQRTIVLLI